MEPEHFVKVVEEALDSIPREFRRRIRNVADSLGAVKDLPNSPTPGLSATLPQSDNVRIDP